MDGHVKKKLLASPICSRLAPAPSYLSICSLLAPYEPPTPTSLGRPGHLTSSRH